MCMHNYCTHMENVMCRNVHAYICCTHRVLLRFWKKIGFSRTCKVMWDIVSSGKAHCKHSICWYTQASSCFPCVARQNIIGSRMQHHTALNQRKKIDPENDDKDEDTRPCVMSASHAWKFCVQSSLLNICPTDGQKSVLVRRKGFSKNSAKRNGTLCKIFTGNVSLSANFDVARGGKTSKRSAKDGRCGRCCMHWWNILHTEKTCEGRI